MIITVMQDERTLRYTCWYFVINTIDKYTERLLQTGCIDIF